MTLNIMPEQPTYCAEKQPLSVKQSVTNGAKLIHPSG